MIGEDSLARIVGDKELTRVTTQLCAAYRQDRLKSAISFAKEVEVDAVVFSSMPPVGLKTTLPPCLSDSLISFFLVEPPKVLFEARSYEDFIYNMSSINWEIVVSPPPEPVEFEIAAGENIEFAGLTITISKNEGLPADFKADDNSIEIDSKETAGDKARADGSAGNTDEKMEEKTVEEEKPAHTSGKWLLVIEDRFHTILSEPFSIRVVGNIPGKIEYDVSSVEKSEKPSFRAILTDLRIQ